MPLEFRQRVTHRTVTLTLFILPAHAFAAPPGVCLTDALKRLGLTYEKADRTSIGVGESLDLDAPLPPLQKEIYYADQAPRVGEIIVVENGENPFRVAASYDDERYLELRDILGRRIIVEQRPRLTGEDSFHRVPDEVLGKELRPLPTAEQVTRKEQSISSKVKMYGERPSANVLAGRQSEASSTIRDAVTIKGADEDEHWFQMMDLEAANKRMLAVLDQKRSLTVTDIRQWHKTATHLNHDNVIRGTERLVKEGKTVSHVDSRDTYAGLVYDQGLNDYFVFPAPNKVMPELSSLLARINQMNAQTPLVEIVRVEQRFLALHPFTNGNGRTGRILMDYMLMRTGRKPFPHSIGTRELFFKTPEELTQMMLRTYEEN